ncbi:MAG: hypothetical protein GX790_09075 [Syntrophomonadaceae bacterium]|nr:hypothetical protein [Syntrophomonadaceae bacterium]
MDGMVIVFFSILAICLLLIIITLASLPQLGDERRNFIKMKAQSYTFGVVIVYMLIRVAESIYVTYWTDNSFEGIDPLIFLVVISIIYLTALLFTKKRYGG